MKATSIEQIREHLARGGRVFSHWTNGKYFEVESVHGSSIYAHDWSCSFRCNIVDHWELLPIEEEKVECTHCNGQGGRWDEESIDQWHPCRHCADDRSKVEQRLRQVEHQKALRNKVLFGQTWSMDEQREVWELLTGERIEWGRRCNACGGEGSNGSLSKPFIGLKPRHSPNAELVMENNDYFLAQSDGTMKRMCGKCNGSGYTVRPTWMVENNVK